MGSENFTESRTIVKHNLHPDATHERKIKNLMIYSIYVHFEIFLCSQGTGTGIGVVFSTPAKKKIVNGNTSAESLPPPPFSLVQK